MNEQYDLTWDESKALLDSLISELDALIIKHRATDPAKAYLLDVLLEPVQWHDLISLISREDEPSEWDEVE